MTEGSKRLGYPEFVALAAGDPLLRDRVAGGERLCFETPFRYPGRRGAILIELIPGDGEASPARPVRITDAGGLIKSLDEQGLDVSIDDIVSKTLVHALKEAGNMGVFSGEIQLESTVENIAQDMWRFLQVLAELIGLRHAKYKDALLQLSRRPQTAKDLTSWGAR